MRSLKRAFNKNDELKTPPILVDILFPNLYFYSVNFKNENKRKPIIWCPFDDENSEYVRIFKKKGFEVVNSHIDDGFDFFNYEPENWDIAISNPPFSQKLKVFERLFSFNKPFAMLMNMMAINYQEIGSLFVSKKIQFLIPDKKISFNGKTSSFCSGYVCHDFLICDVNFVHLENNNTGKNFIPAFGYKEK